VGWGLAVVVGSGTGGTGSAVIVGGVGTAVPVDGVTAVDPAHAVSISTARPAVHALRISAQRAGATGGYRALEFVERATAPDKTM
jgi:hypothetical protein